MSIYRELDYTPKIRAIKRVEFGILSPEEIMKRSVTHVHKTTLYENNGDPTTGGLFDPRMGVIDRGKLCKTCHLLSESFINMFSSKGILLIMSYSNGIKYNKNYKNFIFKVN